MKRTAFFILLQILGVGFLSATLVFSQSESGSKMVLLRASVTDKKGNIVTDLKPEDFEVYENGKKQDITNFSFIFIDPQTKQLENTMAQKNADKKNAIPIPPVKLRAE